MQTLTLPPIIWCECGNPADDTGECRQCRERNASRAWRQHTNVPMGLPHTVRISEAICWEKKKQTRLKREQKK